MGVVIYTQEFTCAIPPARMFKALILDSHNLCPKLMPQSIKSIDILGDGGVGTIKQTNFTEASPYKYVKHRIDALDKENFICKNTMIEGDALGDKLTSVVYEVKFEASADGGCICKMSSEYHTVGDAQFTEEDVKAGKEGALGMYKAVEAYLLQNPDAYA
ncbi:PREDICTED: major allergen Pru ar 1-like [Nelumbo nucifera]|uniref:Major allergen Pru ar 1-like n=1 Tax=Nelumbo nucifera TaxID=4432 RepID=A0A1U7ZZX1_NELNU|nr:PREDICTED: major allergen Pru ar 1-like [Nelumbo nucifera]